MKKLLLLATSLFLFSCSTDDASSEPEANNPTNPTEELCTLSIRKIESKKNDQGKFVVISDYVEVYEDNFATTTPTSFHFSNGIAAGSAPKVLCGGNSLETVYFSNTQVNGVPDSRSLKVIQTTGNTQ
jgi:hypothetical protein